MGNQLQLLTTREFNGHVLDCYVEPEQEDKSNFWATREQIGVLLAYERPNEAIAHIHDRNKERMDTFSTVLKLSKVEGNRSVTRDTRVYNFKGLLEICRYSNQPNAHKVIDVLWDIADEIRRNGIYMTDKAADAYLNNPEVFKAMAERCSALEKRIAELNHKVDEMYPLHILGAVVAPQKGAISFKDAADLLAQYGIDIGQNRLFKKCREKKLLCSRKGRQWNKPSKAAIDKGLFALEISGGFNFITMIRPRGLQVLADMLVQENYPLFMLLQKKETE